MNPLAFQPLPSLLKFNQLVSLNVKIGFQYWLTDLNWMFSMFCILFPICMWTLWSFYIVHFAFQILGNL